MKKEALIKKAEELINKSPESIRQMSADDIKNIVHELNLHQKELEMQNEELRRFQLELNESKDIYTELFEFAPFGYVVLDLDNRIIKANHTICSILGVDKSQILKKVFNNFISSESQDAFHLQRLELMDKKTKKTCELEMIKKDGDKFYALLECTVVLDSEGIVSGIRASIGGISDRKQVKGALIESEKRFRKMFSENAAVMLLIDPESGVITNANKAAQEFYGYSYQELCSIRIQEINQLSSDEVIKEIQNAQNRKANCFIFPHKLKNGQVRTVEVHSTPMEINNKKMLFSIIHDITDRKQAEEALLEKQEMNNLLLNSMPYPIMLINKNRIVVAANKIAMDVGAIIEDYCWKEFGKCDYLSEENKEHALKDPDYPGIQCKFCRMDQIFDTNEPANDPAVNAFGRLWDTYWIPINDSEYLHYAIDITDQKKAEDELKKYRDNLEELVKERTKELEEKNEELAKFNELFVDREFRIKELRDRIKELEQQD